MYLLKNQRCGEFLAGFARQTPHFPPFIKMILENIPRFNREYNDVKNLKSRINFYLQQAQFKDTFQV